jgi:hypothetical protein
VTAQFFRHPSGIVGARLQFPPSHVNSQATQRLGFPRNGAYIESGSKQPNPSEDVRILESKEQRLTAPL